MGSLFARQDVDPELCHRYAQFASHLEKWQFRIIYWSMFVANLFVLFIASWTYTRGHNTLERYNQHSAKRAKRLRQSIMLCAGCVMVSTVIVVMEAYAILALQFCDGEDLISLYWSTWTMIQIGSLIAMIGIILALGHSLSDRRHPPWALALGTPVLVIAGFLHLIHDCIHKRVKKQLQKSKRTGRDDACGPPMSQSDTIQVNPEEGVEEEPKAVLIGFTVKGGPIIRFVNKVPDPLPAHTELLGYGEDKLPLVVCHSEGVSFISESGRRDTEASIESCQKESF